MFCELSGILIEILLVPGNGPSGLFAGTPIDPNSSTEYHQLNPPSAKLPSSQFPDPLIPV